MPPRPAGHSRQRRREIYRATSLTRKCLLQDGSNVQVVTIPFVFRYLLAELAAMNIQVQGYLTRKKTPSPRTLR